MGSSSSIFQRFLDNIHGPWISVKIIFVIASSKQTQFLSYGKSPFFQSCVKLPKGIAYLGPLSAWTSSFGLHPGCSCLMNPFFFARSNHCYVWFATYACLNLISVFRVIQDTHNISHHCLFRVRFDPFYGINTAGYPIVWFHHYQHTGYLRSYLCVWAASQHTRSQTCLGKHSHFSRKPHLQTVIMFISMDLHRMVPPSFLFVGLET